MFCFYTAFTMDQPILPQFSCRRSSARRGTSLRSRRSSSWRTGGRWTSWSSAPTSPSWRRKSPPSPAARHRLTRPAARRCSVGKRPASLTYIPLCCIYIAISCSCVFLVTARMRLSAAVLPSAPHQLTDGTALPSPWVQFHREEAFYCFISVFSILLVFTFL